MSYRKNDAKGHRGPFRQSRRNMLQWAGAGMLGAGLAGCAAPLRSTAVPRGRTTSARVLGLENERYYPLIASDALAIEREFLAAVDRALSKSGVSDRSQAPDFEMLSISGGGENGAFGAGLLCGWSEQGKRPVFNLVTGISTGALTAPFAFLGPAYDAQLRSVYTETTAADILITRYYIAAFYDDAMADTSPLFALISRYVDQKMLDDIARAYDDGRMLLIATTDLDAQLPVIWNIGAIAKSGHPEALDTVRKILRASAAIPGAFPPVMFDVKLDGQPYQEMHVDGGTFAQAFLYPSSVSRTRRERKLQGLPIAKANAFIIRNGRLDPEWSAVNRVTLGIAGRAISTMISASGMNDVLRLYSVTQRDDVNYNLAFIPSDFNEELKEPFDQKFMRVLFDYGYQKGRQGYEWHKQPPNV